MVKELREQTAPAMMDVKSALVEADGNMEEATSSCARRVWPRQAKGWPRHGRGDRDVVRPAERRRAVEVTARRFRRPH